MWKWALVALGVLVLLAAGALLLLPYFLDLPAIQAYAASAAGQALGRPVKFASLSVSTFPLPSVRLQGLQVAEDPAFGPGPFLTVREGRLSLRLLPLLTGRVELAGLTLEEPRIQIVEDRAGRLNLGTLAAGPSRAPGAAKAPAPGGGGAAAGGLLLSRVQIADGTVRYTRLGARGPEYQLEKVNATLKQAGLGEALQLTGDALVQPGALRITISEATLGAAAARALVEAPLKASVELEAKDVGALLAGFFPAPALAGPLRGRLEIGGTLVRATARGNLRSDRLVLTSERPECPPPRRRQLVVDDLRLPVALEPAAFRSAPVHARTAGGELDVELTLALEPAVSVTLKDIRVRGLQLEPVLVQYLCQPYAVTGPLDLSGELRAQGTDPWRTASGAGQFRIGAGRVVGSALLRVIEDAVGLFGAVSSLARPDRAGRRGQSPLDFDSITATYTITNGVAKTEDLLYQARDFQVAGAGTYGLADGRVAMDVTLTQGTNQAKARVAGAPGSLRVVPTGVKVSEPRDLRRFLDRLFR
jgi:AsmA protein